MSCSSRIKLKFKVDNVLMKVGRCDCGGVNFAMRASALGGASGRSSQPYPPCRRGSAVQLPGTSAITTSSSTFIPSPFLITSTALRSPIHLAVPVTLRSLSSSSPLLKHLSSRPTCPAPQDRVGRSTRRTSPMMRSPRRRSHP
jgi:hypothetical protein